MHRSRRLAISCCLALLAIRATAGPLADEVNERDIQARYDRVAASWEPTEYRVRHILVESQAAADAALRRIQGGESFADVAREVSIDRASAVLGGTLEWNGARSFVPPFSDTVLALAPRGLSSTPIRTPFGWHVVEVLGTRPHPLPTYARMHDQIADELRRETVGR